MGTTKTEQFSEKQIGLASLAKALAHPARIAILEHLMCTESCICGEIVDEIGLAQATVSQHLKELKNAGIIKGSIEGTSVCYCIDSARWSVLKKELETFIGNITVHCKCC